MLSQYTFLASRLSRPLCNPLALNQIYVTDLAVRRLADGLIVLIHWWVSLAMDNIFLVKAYHDSNPLLSSGPERDGRCCLSNGVDGQRRFNIQVRP